MLFIKLFVEMDYSYLVRHFFQSVIIINKKNYNY